MKKIKFVPQKKLGHWTIYFLSAFVVAFLFFWVMILIGQRGGETFFSNLLLTIPGLIIAISGVSMFFTGILSVAKEKERSPLVFFAIFWGLITLIIVLGEFGSPH